MKTLISAALISLLPVLANAATLELPSSIWANKVNGEAVPSYRSALPLKAGLQILELRYAELLQLNAEDHEYVSSEPLYLSFEAQDHQSYRLQLPQLRSDAEVREFARQPEVSLRSDAGPVESRLLTQSQLLALMARASVNF
ncbi:DUF2057 family protein [Ferrimonas sp. YFM]|uniref:DUF2057 family protein n=1 Tax=Ferrimonas sp. YFM TaxID=3028878 RepID=UPI00257323C1|nr:DUF2057 family protein [Ferrimonas sp. YFM]BDY03114.1 hypothetical protein F0521_01550 [Ferrimonas sp. YFM]